jgi:kynurenine formamidase
LFCFSLSSSPPQADLHRRGTITQVDYTLFKLQQMQSVDEATLARLTERFTALDTRQKGLLSIGLDVPSAAQVKRFEEELGLAKTNDPAASVLLNTAWKAEQHKLRTTRRRSFGSMPSMFQTSPEEEEEAVQKLQSRAVHAATAAVHVSQAKKKPIRLSECHSFSWSRNLWNETANTMMMDFAFLFALYFLLGYFCMCSPQVSDDGALPPCFCLKTSFEMCF